MTEHAWRDFGWKRTKKIVQGCVVCKVMAECPHGCGPLDWADDSWICPKCLDEWSDDTFGECVVESDGSAGVEVSAPAVQSGTEAPKGENMSKTTTAKAPKPVMQYHRDGRPITNPSVNTLSGVAYFHTKGVDGKPRVTTKRLTEILDGLGVKSPKTEAFDVQLPGGPRIAATVGELAAPQPRISRATEPKVATAAGDLSATDAKRMADIDAMRAEGKALREWKAAGSKGTKPATPVTDARDAELKAKEAKRAEAEPTTAHVAAVKPTAKPPVNRKTVTPITKASQTQHPSRKQTTKAS